MQNHASSYCCVHRPATHDDVVAQIIAVREMVPAALVQSWTSDFAKAYRQVPQISDQLMLTVVVQYCLETQGPVFVVSYGQLFGGRTPPLNFSRQPAWWCYVMAPLIGLPLQHTVDDVIATEQKAIAVCVVTQHGEKILLYVVGKSLIQSHLLLMSLRAPLVLT